MVRNPDRIYDFIENQIEGVSFPKAGGFKSSPSAVNIPQGSIGIATDYYWGLNLFKPGRHNPLSPWTSIEVKSITDLPRAVGNKRVIEFTGRGSRSNNGNPKQINFQIIFVPAGTYGWAQDNGSDYEEGKATRTVILEPGYHIYNRSNLHYFGHGPKNTPIQQIGNSTLVNIPQSKFRTMEYKGKYYLLGPGIHEFTLSMPPTINNEMEMSDADIHHGNLHLFQVNPGRVYLVTYQNQPYLLPEGNYFINDSTFKMIIPRPVRRKKENNDRKYEYNNDRNEYAREIGQTTINSMAPLRLGPYTVFKVDTGSIGVIYDENGKAKHLDEGIHIITSPQEYAGTYPTSGVKMSIPTVNIEKEQGREGCIRNPDAREFRHHHCIEMMTKDHIRVNIAAEMIFDIINEEKFITEALSGSSIHQDQNPENLINRTIYEVVRLLLEKCIRSHHYQADPMKYKSGQDKLQRQEDQALRDELKGEAETMEALRAEGEESQINAIREDFVGELEKALNRYGIKLQIINFTEFGMANTVIQKNIEEMSSTIRKAQLQVEAEKYNKEVARTRAEAKAVEGQIKAEAQSKIDQTNAEAAAKVREIQTQSEVDRIKSLANAKKEAAESEAKAIETLAEAQKNVPQYEQQRLIMEAAGDAYGKLHIDRLEVQPPYSLGAVSDLFAICKTAAPSQLIDAKVEERRELNHEAAPRNN